MVAEKSAGRPLAAVIRLHAYGELKEADKATAAYEELRGNPDPIFRPVRDELAARYVLHPEDFVAKPDGWVFDEECRLLLCLSA